MNVLLGDFTESMHKLQTSVISIIHNNDELSFGLLVAVMVDTPAANLLGGFKEGVSFANMPRRMCEIHRVELSHFCCADQVVMRDETEHRDTVSELRNVSKETFKFWSKTHGFNSGLALLEIPGFCIRNVSCKTSCM